MLRKTEEIKNLFAAIVADKGNCGRQKGEAVNQSTAPNLQKGGKKEQAEDAYRSIFMKTLKARK